MWDYTAPCPCPASEPPWDLRVTTGLGYMVILTGPFTILPSTHAAVAKAPTKSLLPHPAKEVGPREPGGASGHLPETPAGDLPAEKGQDVAQSMVLSFFQVLSVVGH